MSEKPDVEKAEKRKYAQRPFPIHSLEEALKVARALQDKNAGKPLKPLFVAEAIEIKVGSSNFREITSSSLRYGLTDGSWNSDQISLTDLGRSLTKPKSPEQELKAKQEAVLNIELFKHIYEHYKDAKFPNPDNYLKNLFASDFGLPAELFDECIKLLIENGKYARIIVDSQGASYVLFEEKPIEQPTTHEGLEVELAPPKLTETKPVPPAPQVPVINQIFVVHGRNTIPLEQLKKILTEFKIPFKIAQEEPNVGRPISQKVADLMRACTSAIVLFTADEEYTDAEGKKVCRPSDNAVYELGAASVLYNNKIVILKEVDVSLATDFKDLGYIRFEKDQLDVKSLDIMKEFIGIGILKVTPA
jgi:predicted nucleotide-binding protein